jgi:hypothetical protein
MDLEELRALYQEMGYPRLPSDIDNDTRRKFNIPVGGDIVAGVIIPAYNFANGKWYYIVDDYIVDSPLPDNLKSRTEFEANIFAAMAMTPDPMLEGLIAQRKTIPELVDELGLEEDDILFRLMVYYCGETGEG